MVAPNDLGELRQLDVIGGEVFLKHVSAESRFKRNLVLSEFIVAFGKYKNIMCEAYPFRRIELDLYERDIIEMATRYGGTTFYEYHKAFSARAAAMLEQRNIKIDWSVRDNKTFCSLFAGSRVVACEICSSLSHTTDLCSQLIRPMQGQNNGNRKFKSGATPVDKAVDKNDKRGRAKVEYLGHEVCNNFNGAKGLFRNFSMSVCCVKTHHMA